MITTTLTNAINIIILLIIAINNAINKQIKLIIENHIKN